MMIIGSLSSDVFERRTSTGSEPFSLLVRLYATVFVLPSVLSGCPPKSGPASLGSSVNLPFIFCG